MRFFLWHSLPLSLSFQSSCLHTVQILLLVFQLLFLHLPISFITLPNDISVSWQPTLLARLCNEISHSLKFFVLWLYLQFNFRCYIISVCFSYSGRRIFVSEVFGTELLFLSIFFRFSNDVRYKMYVTKG